MHGCRRAVLAEGAPLQLSSFFLPAETQHDPSIIVRNAVTGIIALVIDSLYAVSSFAFLSR